MSKNKFPPGWDEACVRKVIAHYEGQSDEDAAAEDDCAFADSKTTAMAIPVELVAEVRKLLQRTAKPAKASPKGKRPTRRGGSGKTA